MAFQEGIKSTISAKISEDTFLQLKNAGGYTLNTGSGTNCRITSSSPFAWDGSDMNAFFRTGTRRELNTFSANLNNPDIVISIPLYNSDNEIVDYVIWYAAYDGNTFKIGGIMSSDGTYAGRYASGTKYNYFHADFAPSAPEYYIENGVYFVPYYTVRNNNIICGLCCIANQNPDINLWRFVIEPPFYASINLTKLCKQLSAHFETQTYSAEFGEASTTGGYTGGTFDDSSDVISIPSAPTMGVTSAGFINVYSPTQGELVQFGSELFPDLSFTPVSQGGSPASVTDALVAMAQVLVDFGNQIPQIIDMYINANLINYVIDCHILPIAPTTAGNAPLKVGFKTFSQTPLKVSSDYVDFNCGSLNVGEYYANFADYSPYTSAKLYLPFVGFMDIAPEYWQSGTLSVTYRFNVIDGSFVAYVKSTSSKSKLSDTVIAQFGGNACVHIPITGLNYASMVSGIVSAVSPLLPSSKSGAGTADTLVNSANTIASAKPTMQQSNGYNATTSFLTVRVPYLLIERSVSNFSRNFAEENGIPSNITTSFAGLTGFTKATMLHLDGIAGATDDDLNEIAQLLSEGVIL